MFEFDFAWAFLALPLPFLMRLLPATKPIQMAALNAPLMRLHKLDNTVQVSSSKKSQLGLAIIIWVLLVSSAAKPQWLGEPIVLPNEGRDIMLAVDLSGSMQIEDMQVSGQQIDRLTMIKFVMSEFITRRIGDRLGLILFADTAYLQTPITYDLNTVAQMLQESQLGLVGDKTAIGDAIGLAAKRFSQRKQSNKILVLLTDGQNTSGNLEPTEALELAKKAGIKIYTIGVGADEILVQGFFGVQKQNPSRDLDERMLTTLAKETGGEYFRAKDTNQLQKIYQILDQLEPISSDELKMRPLTALFYWPLACALLLCFLWANAAWVELVMNRFKQWKQI